MPRRASLARLALTSAVALSGGLSLGLPAEAASPVRPGPYSACDGSGCAVTFRVSRRHTMRDFRAYVRCGPLPAIPAIRVSGAGRFAYRGSLSTPHARFVAEVRGRFSASGVVTGTVSYRRAGCRSGTVPFRALRL